MTKRLWVIEMFDDRTGAWEPTSGVAFTRAEAIGLRRIWRQDNPDDTFRVRAYEAVRHD